jgi:hypothetical protein
MLASLVKVGIYFPLATTIVASSVLFNGGTIDPQLTFVFMSIFFIFVNVLMVAIFKYLRMNFSELKLLHIEERSNVETNIFGFIESDEDLAAFLGDLEAKIKTEMEGRP